MKKIIKLMTVFMLQLMILLPLASALQISNVFVTDISDNVAKINWETDEAADSRVFYGESKDNLIQTKTDINSVTTHEVLLSNLNSETNYYYKVKSDFREEDNNGDAYSFTTDAVDNSAPYIKTEIPEYSNKARIDIVGTSKPLTKVDLYVNGVKQRSSSPDEAGDFNFPNVELSTFVVNQITLHSIDQAGNFIEETFQTTVDVEKPEITLQDMQFTSTEDNVLLKGSISETALLEITVNEEIIFQDEVTGAFSKSIPLVEGENIVELRAIDKAGNADTISKSITSDSQPPVFESIKPESGAFFYEGNTEVDIEGLTEAFAIVELYLDKEPDGKPNRRVTADATGDFAFDDVDLEGDLFDFVGVKGDVEHSGYKPVSRDDLEESSSNRLVKEGDGKQKETTVKITVVATDAVGQQTVEKLSYSIGTCFSGKLEWTLTNMVEYQSPTLLSPERLSEGTEILSAIVKLDYRGNGQNERIKNIRFKRACKATSMLEDERYNISCQIMSSQPEISKSNDKQDLHYLRFNLDKFEGLEEFYTSNKDLTKELVFPMTVEVNYVHDVGGEEKEEWQTSCMNLAYAVDTSRIDPRDVLPDWVLGEGLTFINTSVTQLNSILDKVNTVMKFAAISCLIGFGLKTITVIFRRWQSWFDYLADKPISWEDDDGTKCPQSRIRGKFNPLPVGAAVNSETKQEDLSNTDLETRCPSAYVAWKTEATAYKAYRWACDRFLCKSAPARWTEGAEPEQVRLAIENNMMCSEGTGTQGAILRKANADVCEENTGQVACWIYKNEYYVLDSQEGERAFLKWTNVENPIRKPGVEAKLEVTLKAGNVMKYEPDKKCKDICTKPEAGIKWAESKCMTAEAVSAELSNNRDHKVIFQANECNEKEQMCVCLDKKTEKGYVDLTNPPTDTLKGFEEEETGEDKDNSNVWDYRYSKVGYQYDKYRYYDERDQSACFGQNNLIAKGDPYLNPADTIPAFQCACISQIRNRLVVLRNILSGLSNCIQQIQLTGKADAGVCKEIFTQYVCKWTYKLVSYFMQGCTPWSGTGKDTEVGIGDYLQAGTQAIYGGLEESATDLISDYDSTAVRDYIGIGEGAIANKVCLGALTGDWSWDLEGFMDTAYSAPFHTSANAFPASREYLTWNPDNDQATYEYKVGWMLTPGCDMASYSVDLACVTDFERFNFDNVRCDKLTDNPNAPPAGCDCVSASQGSLGPFRDRQNSAGPSHNVFVSRGLTQGSFIDGSKHLTDEQSFRYDHVKITVYAKNEADAKKCIPESNRVGSRSGVFYAPISDKTTYDIAACRWNMATGRFECNGGAALWSQRGKSFFGDIKCNEGDGKVDCRDKFFYAGDQLKLDDVKVYTQGKKHCMVVTLKNGHGTTMSEEIFEYGADPTDPNKWAETHSPNTIFLLKDKVIEESDFTKATPSARVTPTGSGLVKLGANKDVTFGNSSIWIRNVKAKGSEFTGEYSLVGTDPWISFKKDTILTVDGINFKFASKPLGVKKTDLKEYKVYIETPRQSITKAPWHAILELRHAPETENGNVGQCSDSIKEDVVSYQGVDMKYDIPLRVDSRSEEESQTCPDKSGIGKNSAGCDCNGDGFRVEDSFDCDASTKFYCHPDGACRDYPKCRSGDVINSVACDCDGTASTAENCIGNTPYCVDGFCSSEKQKVDNEKPKIISTKIFGRLPPYSNKIVVSGDEIEVKTTDNVKVSDLKVTVDDKPYKLEVISQTNNFKMVDWSLKVENLKKGTDYVVKITAIDSSNNPSDTVTQIITYDGR